MPSSKIGSGKISNNFYWFQPFKQNKFKTCIIGN